jgi:hypothetical protein
MKLALLVILGFAGSIALANGLDAKQYNYGDEAFFPKAASNCVDGTKEYFVESVNGLDRYVNVERTCENGVFYPVTTTQVQPCQEGAVAFWTKAGGTYRSGRTTEYVCVGGKYIVK